MLTLVRQELHQLGFTDDQIDGGGLRVTTTFTRKAMAAAAAGVLAVRPEDQRQVPPRRGRDGPARHRRAGRLLRRPGLPAVPDQLGRGRRHGRVDLQAGLAGRRDHRRLLAEEHLGRQLAVHVPRRSRGPQRGRRRRAPTTAPPCRRCYALEQSINTAFVDMSDEHEGRARQDPHDGQQDGDPAGRAGPAVPRHPELDRATSRPTP